MAVNKYIKVCLDGYFNVEKSTARKPTSLTTVAQWLNVDP